MKRNYRKMLGALLLAVTMFLSVLPCMAAETKQVTIVMEDITGKPEALPILAGEAKIKVSAKGIDDPIYIAQLLFQASGDMKYKSIQYLLDEGNDDGAEYLQAVELTGGKMMSSAVRLSAPLTTLKKDEMTDLFILTYSGEPGATLDFSMAEADETDNLESYVVTDDAIKGETVPAVSETESVTATAAESGSEPIHVSISLKMNKVHSFEYFEPGLGKESGLIMSITGGSAEKPVSYYIPIQESTGAIIPTMSVETTLIKGETYTVEIGGPGYISYKENILFDELLEDGEDSVSLELNNDVFQPGELIEDGVIDGKDKAEFNSIRAKVESGEMDYNMAADFNRDGVIDDSDALIYANIPDEPTTDDGDKEDNKDDDKDDDTNGGGTNGGDTNGGGTNGGSTNGGGTTGGGTTGGGGSRPSGGGTGGSGFGGGSVTGEGQKPANSNETFTDIDNYAWAKDSIYTLKEKGIISGVSETEFAPANNIKRGDFILILTRMLGINDEFTENFEDVPETAYYYDAIGKAKAAGIATGDGINFNPEASITRQDLITLAYRAFSIMGFIEETEDYSSLDAFGDKDSIAGYATAPMASMVSAGIIKGSDGNVNPLGNATRAEVAVMCARLLNLMK